MKIPARYLQPDSQAYSTHKQCVYYDILVDDRLVESSAPGRHFSFSGTIFVCLTCLSPSISATFPNHNIFAYLKTSPYVFSSVTSPEKAIRQGSRNICMISSYPASLSSWIPLEWWAAEQPDNRVYRYRGQLCSEPEIICFGWWQAIFWNELSDWSWNSMQTIVRPISLRARAKQGSVLGPYECSKIFMNIEQLLQVNDAFRLDLEKYRRQNSAESSFGEICLTHVRISFTV